MRRIGFWFYYLWALLTPVHDTFIWSPFLGRSPKDLDE